jgi:hypothetical protein
MRAWAALASSSVLYALATAWAATQLPPDGVPLHFGAGTANRLGSQNEAMTTSAVLGVVMLGVGVGLVLLARYGPLRAMNIPHKSYWLAEHREPEVRRMRPADMALIMSAPLVFLSLIPLWTALGAKAHSDAPAPLLFEAPIGEPRNDLPTHRPDSTRSWLCLKRLKTSSHLRRTVPCGSWTFGSATSPG